MLKLTIFFLLIVTYNAHGQTKNTVISGRLKNFSNREMMRDYSEIIELQLQYMDIKFPLVPDSMGNFSLKFNLLKPGYYLLGRNTLYLQPNDKLDVVIDYESPELSTFKGRGSQANNYLKNTPFAQSGSYVAGGSGIKKTVGESIVFLEGEARNRTNALKSLQHISSQFRRLEEVRIKADMLNSFNNVADYFVTLKKISPQDSKKIYVEADSLLKPLYIKYNSGIISSDYLKIDVYRKILSTILKSTDGDQIERDKIEDYLSARSLARKIMQISDKQELGLLKSDVIKVRNGIYRGKLNELISFKALFNNGDTAKEIIGEDVKGKKIALTAFRGKVIYLDFWATWCGPCIDEMPYFNQLREKYASNPDVIFISVSIDDNKELWKTKLQQSGAKGIQLIIDIKRNADYQLHRIPRTILISKDFKIAEMYGPQPSSKQAEEKILALIK